MKRILLVTMVMIFTLKVQSQDLSGGAKIGLNGSSIIAGGSQKTDQVGILAPTFHAGIYGRIQIVHFFRFQLEALYSQRGGSFDNLSDNKIIAGNTYNITYTDKLNYLDIPLVFMLHGGISSFQIGVQQSFLLNQSTEIDGTIVDGSGNAVRLEDVFGGDITNFRTYSNNDFSFLMGFQFDIPMGINVGLRVLYSLGNIYDIDRSKIDPFVTDPANNNNNFSDFYRFDNARNVSAQLSVGYTFKK